MAIFTTKIELSNGKYYQLTGDTLSLSGMTYLGKAQYLQDLSINFVDRSLIDKQYLDYRLVTFSGSSSTLVSGATNGLTLLNKAIKLGGNLTNNTDIDTTTNTFRIGELSNFGPYLSIDPSNFGLVNSYNPTDYSIIATNDTLKSLEFTTSVTGKTATYILNQNGLQAGNNYYSGNTNNPRWIPDKAYVDANNITTVNFNNGLIKRSNTISLGGTLTGNTIINQNNKNITFNNGKIISSGSTGQGFDSYSDYKLSGTTILSTLKRGFSFANLAIGNQTLSSNTLGSCNLAIGNTILCNNTSGCLNIGIGYNTLSSNTLGSCNLAIGNFSQTISCNSCDNISLGNQTLLFNINGKCNIAIGNKALYNNSAGNDNTAIGFQTLYNNTSGCTNIAIGDSVLYNNIIGNDNIGIGCNALYANINGCNNFAAGCQALYLNCNGNNNIAISCQSLYNNCNGNDNLAMGNSALYNNLDGSNNIALGCQTLYQNLIGTDNFAAGYQALFSNTGGTYNIAIGNSALYGNLSGNNNIANGQFALLNNICGESNIANGYYALFNNICGHNNIANGVHTLDHNTTGCNNIANGNQTLCSNTIGSSNIGNGLCSLFSNSTGNNNVSYGSFAGFNVTGSSNIMLGYSAGRYETGSNTLYIDNIDRTNLSLGKTNSLLYGVTNITPSLQTLITNSKFTATYGINIPTGNTYTIGNNNIQNHYKHLIITGATTLTGSEYVVFVNKPTAPVTINLPLTPVDETAFKIKDVGGNALSNNITISGNTRNIDGSTTSLINTNYGAVELTYNKTINKWYTLSSIN